jgi:myo-inositol-1(or 4)-monophosphatase
LFTAVAGRGAALNGTPIHCRASTSLATALVATGFSYTTERRVDQARRVHQLIGHIRDIRRIGAASTDLCYLAAGRLDAYYEQWVRPWDWAAAELIAREAGCRTGRIDGRPLSWTVPFDPAHGILAATPALFEPLVDLLASTEPAAGIPGTASAPAPGIM